MLGETDTPEMTVTSEELCPVVSFSQIKND
jgi:hypothetical protein